MGKFICVVELHFNQNEGEDSKPVQHNTVFVDAKDEAGAKKIVEAYGYANVDNVNWVYVYDVRDVTDALYIKMNAVGKAL